MAIVKQSQKRQSHQVGSLKIQLLGPMKVLSDDKIVIISSRKVRALLAYIVLRPGVQIPRSIIANLLWGERSDTQAFASLRQALTELRAALGSCADGSLQTSKESVSWIGEEAWVDANVLASAIKGRDDDLQDARSIPVGDLLEGISIDEPNFEQWLATERQRFRSHFVAFHSRLAEVAEREGKLEEAIGYYLTIVSLDPVREQVHRKVMQLFALQGRYDAALAQYERCRRELAAELGIAPETQTDELAGTIRAKRRISKSASPRSDAASVQPILSSAEVFARPSIAVLPFVNTAGGKEHEYFVDGLTDDIINALSRFSSLFVIARTSTFIYKERAVDVKHVAAELDVRYVLEGSVQRTGDSLRITTQLVDALTGHAKWAERYDRSLTDLFAIQDEITRSVVASIDTQVRLAERFAAETRPSINFKARDLLARASGLIYEQTAQALDQASRLVSEALEIDPADPLAHRLLADMELNRIWILFDLSRASHAFDLARTALRLAPSDEYAHLTMAWAWAYALGSLDDAIAECERGLEINPNCSMIMGNLGLYSAAQGRSNEAIQIIELALKLNPRDPSNFWRHYAIAVAHFAAGNFSACLLVSRKVARSRTHLPSAIFWVASAAALNKADDMTAAIGDCMTQRPDLRVSMVVPNFVLRFASDESHNHLLRLLGQAGMPE
jgi:TolB-like protein